MRAKWERWWPIAAALLFILLCWLLFAAWLAWLGLTLADLRHIIWAWTQ